jgi:predicted transcriptional regulator
MDIGVLVCLVKQQSNAADMLGAAAAVGSNHLPTKRNLMYRIATVTRVMQCHVMLNKSDITFDDPHAALTLVTRCHTVPCSHAQVAQLPQLASLRLPSWDPDSAVGIPRLPAAAAAFLTGLTRLDLDEPAALPQGLTLPGLKVRVGVLVCSVKQQGDTADMLGLSLASVDQQ